MTLHRAPFAWRTLCFLALLLPACQRLATTPSQTTTPPVASATLPGGEAAGGERPLQALRVVLHPESGLVDMEPLRQGQAGLQDVLETVDVTQYFTNAPCTSCLKIVGVGTSTAGRPTLAVQVRHPFTSPAPGAQQRQDLAVFNVEAVVRFDETGQSLTSFPGTGVSAVTSTRLVNADGYTGNLDAAYDEDYRPTVATIHPYRLFFRDYSRGTFDAGSPQGFPDYSDIRGFLVMGQGQGPDEQLFEFQVPAGGGPIRFDLVLQASFGVASANVGERAAPEYRLPQYNKKAASEVRVGLSDVVPGNLSGRGLLSGIGTSGAQVRLSVLDITDASTGVTVGPDRDQLRAASDVAQLRIEIPGVLNSAITINNPASVFEGGTGDDPVQPLTYGVGITNQAAATQGTYFGVVRVGDSYPLGGNIVLPQDAHRKGVVPGFTDPFPLAEVATYQVFEVPVKVNTIARFEDASAGDALGTSLAWGDFNGDGLPDLAVGAFEADPGGVSNGGQVRVYYQLPNGFLPVPVVLQEATPVLNNRLGFCVAAGDVTGDGKADLLASAINGNIPGRVAVFRSQGIGFLPPLTVQDLSLPVNSRFGWTITLADINSDGRLDAYIGAPEALGSFLREGLVYRYLGGPGGISMPQTLSTPDPQLDAYFGSSIAVLREPSGTPSQLAIGMPGYNSATGRVYVYPISAGGTLGTAVVVNPTSGGPNDAYGYSLATADFTQDGRMDLVVGAPGSASTMTGRVDLEVHLPGGNFVRGATLTATGTDTFTFGSSLAIGDFDFDGRLDIAAGGIMLEASGVPASGRVAVFPGGRNLGGNALEFHAPIVSTDQLFARSLLGFPQPGKADLLLVGAPGDDPGGATNAGSVYLY